MDQSPGVSAARRSQQSLQSQPAHQSHASGGWITNWYEAASLGPKVGRIRRTCGPAGRYASSRDHADVIERLRR
ncbi:MAG: hypothetical protein ACYDB7_05560, partial [Mycobacteriales bacterium]